ncbi:DODA-type extradiol aromatic ring-opening family dioxygenase [Kordiimonas pumila]|uniref:Catechol 1,2-dioxygenase n=1 Tax=Kordiimonas pumila TaxID=2161677 RepID=A0ABV7D4L5_9PROT|nr:catechol 1,2-dioxygenase [Kordiimonas pumila]
MGEIVGVGLVSHAPPIMMPQETRFALNDGKEITLVPGLKQLRSEVIDVLKPDAVIVFDTHWFSTVEFIITGHERRSGKYTSEELPRGMKQIPFNLKGDASLAKLAAAEAVASGVPCIANDDPYLPIHYPTINIAHFLHSDERDEAWLSVSVCQTGTTKNFLDVGKAIGEAVKKSGKRVVLLASGGMSHRFWPLDELIYHEASDPIHVFTPEARAADEQRLAWFKAGDHASVINNMDAYMEHKPEGKFAHYLMMASAVGGTECKATGRLFGEYENSTGTGQVHVWFDRPENGWT